MEYTKELLEKNKVKFTITASEEEWEHGLEHAYEHSKDKFNVQGFRKGKAPRHIIEKNYGENVFYEDALYHTVNHNYGEILEKEPEVEPIDAPSINVLSIDKGVKYEIVVEVKPQVILGEYKNLEIKKEKTDVLDEEVETELKLCQDKASRLISVDRPAKEGDTVNIDFSGSLNGKKFDGGSSKDYDLVLGSKSFIPGFEEQIVGMKKGETKTISVTFPETYFEESLKGQKTDFEIVCNDVREKELPQIDDEFAKNYSEFETLEEYKNDIRKTIKENKEKDAMYKAQNELIDKVTDNATVEISDTLVNNQIDDFIKDFEYRLMYQGLKLEDYLKHMNSTIEELRESRREDAKRTAKTKLVLEEIIKRENIEVTEEELNKKLEEMANQRNIGVDEFKKGLNEQFFNRIFGQMVTDKLLDFLTQNNKIN